MKSSTKTSSILFCLAALCEFIAVVIAYLTEASTPNVTMNLVLGFLFLSLGVIYKSRYDKETKEEKTEETKDE